MGPARPEPLWAKSTEEGLEIQVRVVPGARRTGVDGLQEGALKVRLAAPPVDGAANKALLGDAQDLASRLSASTGLTVPVA